MAVSVTLLKVVAQAVAAIALGLLGASGVTKLVDPEPTTGAIRAAHLPAATSLTYALGLVEIVAVILALAFGAPVTLLAAGLYAAFTVFTFAAVRGGVPVQSCGCFGRDDTPPSYIHVVFNLIASVSLVTLATTGRVPIDWGAPFADIALFVGFAIVGVFASYLLLARVPQLRELARPS